VSQPFAPVGATVNVAASGTTGSVALTSIGEMQGSRTVRVANSGSVAAWIAFGGSSVTAAAASGIPVLGGETVVLEVSPKATHVAAITGGTAATVYFTSGKGGS
jgi:hypothetical protein